MGGTKGGEAVSSAAGISLCGDPLWCGLVCGYRMGRRLSRTRLFYGCPLLRSRIFPFFVTFGTFGRLRRRRRRKREGGATGARGRREEGRGRPWTTSTRAQGPQA